MRVMGESLVGAEDEAGFTHGVGVDNPGEGVVIVAA